MQVEMWCHSQGVPGLYQRKDYSHIQRDILYNTQRFEKKTRKCTKTLQKEGMYNELPQKRKKRWHPFSALKFCAIPGFFNTDGHYSKIG